MTVVDARSLNRATLARQLLLERARLPLADALHRVVALQAQSPASPYLGLWNRIDGFDPADLDAAFTRGEVVKSNVPRMTLHAGLATDHRAFREAMEPTIRAARLNDDRYRASGLLPEDADALVPDLVAFAETPRAASDCEAWLAGRLGDRCHPGAWWALRQYAPWLRHPTGGPWSFGPAVAYVAPPEAPSLGDPDAQDAGLQALVRRYLEGFGPATVADVAVFAMVQRGRVTKAVQALGDDLDRLDGPHGSVLLDVPGAPRPPADADAPPRLLGMWDNLLLAHHDRSRVLPEEHRTVVIRRNGDVLPTLLVHGRVAGAWRTSEGRIEALPFEPIPSAAWTGLEVEAHALLDLLADRDHRPFGRHDHWWEKDASTEWRVLAERSG